mmetsp:Transcript_3037/g.8307  ORF Transcript_3037/g.8307 Transcript_3037/m.8307 type:complete len:298 (+) Transcript_3037:1021-1914(+)
MKMMHGERPRAVLKRSRTRAAPRPMYISMNSDADEEMNATPDSPATARAMSVLPLPGGPTSSTPFGALAPLALNFSGLRKKSTTSCSCTLASALPATSSKKIISSDSCTLDSRLRPRRAWRTRRFTSRILGSIALRTRAVLSLPMSWYASASSCPPSSASLAAAAFSLASSSARMRCAADALPAPPLMSCPALSSDTHASYVPSSSVSEISNLSPSLALMSLTFFLMSASLTPLDTIEGTSSSRNAMRASLRAVRFFFKSSWFIMFIRSVRSPRTKRAAMYKPMMKADPMMGPMIGA